MDRRQFLGNAGCLTAGLGIAVPLVGATAPVPLSATNPRGSKERFGLVTNLEKGWSIATDPENIGRKENWATQVQAGSKPIRVPSIIQEVYPGYHGVVWYWVEFTAGTNPYTSGRSLLSFNAVDYLGDVWLNGKYSGTHEGGETPFRFDVTDAIKPGASNLLAVRVLNPVDQAIDGIVLDETPHRNKFVKHANGALFDFGGIIAPVELLFVPAIRIEDIYLLPNWQTGEVEIQTTIRSAFHKVCQGTIFLTVSHHGNGALAATAEITPNIKSGETVLVSKIAITNHRLWSLDDPFLYRISARLVSADANSTHEASVSFGFRDFRVVNGYFRLNGRRLFLKSTHTGNHVPFGQVVPPNGSLDLLRLDLAFAKASGFNTVRFISGVAYPYQLDLCDELGLLVYEETSASWLMKNSPQLKTRYERSVREVLARDRNHPSFAIFGALNETGDGSVFVEAKSSLTVIRSMDRDKLVILSSGRFDGHLEVGSISNPGGSEWEFAWGKEAPNGSVVPMKYPSGIGIGDFHLYPSVPQSREVNQMMRTLGDGGKPVLLSEYGVGSMMDVIHEARAYEQAAIPDNAEDYIEILSMADRFSADWSRFGMETVYPFPETLLQFSQLSMARHRLLGFNLIRANPNICGFNLTGMLDHALTGEGVWRFWRDWKPGAFDAMRDGWSPVRWCLFAEPTHIYAGSSVVLEAVLANEDTVRPGEYEAEFKVWGPKGTTWTRKATISIPIVETGVDEPFAVPVMKQEVLVHGPTGTYEFVPSIAKGIAPPETSWQFYVTDPADFPSISTSVTAWGLSKTVEEWLSSHGIVSRPFRAEHLPNRDLVLVGDPPKEDQSSDRWRALAERMAMGSTVVFLSPQAFQRDKDSVLRLPLAKKGKIYKFNDWLYHKECVAKPHPIFAGLQGQGLLDWYYYGPMLPAYLFDGQDTPAEVVAAAFAAGYSTAGGYASGVLLGSYNFGAGRFFINTFPMLDMLSHHPVADRMLLNLIQYCEPPSNSPSVALPADFEDQLRQIGYVD
jgi:hypothetical protein